MFDFIQSYAMKVFVFFFFSVIMINLAVIIACCAASSCVSDAHFVL